MSGPSRVLVPLLLILLGCSCGGPAGEASAPGGEGPDAPASPPLEVVSSEGAPPAIGPYSQAIAAGGFLFTSGQIPLTAEGELVEGGIAEQTRQVFANLDAVLRAAGCRREDVVKATVFLADLGDFSAMNAAYADFFGEHRPARSTVEVARLARDVLLEIDLVARLPE